jgi:hypothetical protein
MINRVRIYLLGPHLNIRIPRDAKYTESFGRRGVQHVAFGPQVRSCEDQSWKLLHVHLLRLQNRELSAELPTDRSRRCAADLLTSRSPTGEGVLWTRPWRLRIQFWRRSFVYLRYTPREKRQPPKYNTATIYISATAQIPWTIVTSLTLITYISESVFRYIFRRFDPPNFVILDSSTSEKWYHGSLRARSPEGLE